MKNYVTLNNTLQVFYPDGFHVMDEAERSKLKSLGAANSNLWAAARWSVSPIRSGIS